MDAVTAASLQPAAEISPRSTPIFEAQITGQRAKFDRLFGWVMLGQWAFGILIALFYSPYGWEGKERNIHLHMQLAVLLGGAIASLPFYLSRRMPGAALTRHVMAVAQMLWSALFIHLSGGRIETHFHVFGSLAWLAFYLDWTVLLTATLVVAGDHFVRGMLYPESVYGIVNPEWWRFLEHAFWVVFEDAILVWACFNGLATLRDGARREARMEELNEINQNKSAALELMLTELKASTA